MGMEGTPRSITHYIPQSRQRSTDDARRHIWKLPTHNMSGQLAMPAPISPGRSSLQIIHPKDLYASLTENISSKPPSFLALREHDFIVPAPPPPSPISFRVHPDQRPKPPRS
ncbi:uncharacterized protein PgNI_03356 [Pyricularia grisea]|uniref:Uncharacterized protein n=1 Tax=Pyricularia grisea TaxID=148305 RepID=A0A6P8B9I4_PYRGI|nr:uncharacterized protein PgNI_03356 [Pyricularia grisea]TLD12327.1 hypothetical protein PgNI_03356 [Pyricularia grisea]